MLNENPYRQFSGIELASLLATTLEDEMPIMLWYRYVTLNHVTCIFIYLHKYMYRYVNIYKHIHRYYCFYLCFILYSYFIYTAYPPIRNHIIFAMCHKNHTPNNKKHRDFSEQTRSWICLVCVFFTFFTIVKHHFAPPFGRNMFGSLFPSSEAKSQIRFCRSTTLWRLVVQRSQWGGGNDKNTGS